MATKKQIEILTKLKEKLSYRLNNISSKEVNPENGYIWVAGQNGLIGNFTCHYEFIFYNIEEDREKDENTLYLEVHFEDKNCTKFENVLSENDKKILEFTNWGIRNRIIGTADNYCVKIKEKTKTDEIVENAIELLEKLDNIIGTRLAKCISNLKIQNNLSKDGTIVRTREYKNRYVCYPENYSSTHGDIQKALQKNLVKNKAYDEVGIERTLGDIRVDVLGINKNGETDPRKYTYDIYEVKPYDSPTECIREALGQLLYYKYMFEKNGYTVGKLIVVGKNKLEFYDEEYLNKIKELKIDYIPQEISE